METPGKGPAQVPTIRAIDASETLWITGISKFEAVEQPDGSKVIIFTTHHGRKYAIPLQGQLLAHVQNAVSPVTIARVLPPNGHGAH
jgi:hypothetical protein